MRMLPKLVDYKKLITKVIRADTKQAYDQVLTYEKLISIVSKELTGSYHYTQGPDSRNNEKLLWEWLQDFKDSPVYFQPRFRAFE